LFSYLAHWAVSTVWPSVVEVFAQWTSVHCSFVAFGSIYSDAGAKGFAGGAYSTNPPRTIPMQLQLSKTEQATIVNFAAQMSRFSTHPSDLLDFIHSHLTEHYKESTALDYNIALRAISISLRNLIASLDIRND